MLSKLLGKLAPFKLYVYAAIVAMLLTGWAFDRHQQYKKGETACQLKQAQAQASYWEQRSERLADEGKEALKQEKTTSGVINQRQASREASVQKSVELDDGGCVYSPDELRDIAETVREANN